MRTLIISITFFVILFIYLNQTYSLIYNPIGEFSLIPPRTNTPYILNPDSNNSINYFAIGDSLTAGTGVDLYEDSYPYQVAKALSQNNNKVQLEIFGMPGARTLDILNNVNQINVTNSDIVTLMIGVNDIHSRISKKQFKENYIQIIESLPKKTNGTLYLVSIPYIGTSDLIRFPYNIYFKYQTNAFNKIIQDISAQYSLRYIDIDSDWNEQVNQSSLYSEDLFHPSKVGYSLWAQNIYDNFNQ